MEGAINHIPSAGFSLLSYDPDADFGPSMAVARQVIRNMLQKGLPEGICLNVNVPDVRESDLKGIRICTQANGFWKEEFQRREDPNGRDYYWLTGFFHNREPEGGGLGTDEWALGQKYAAIVPVNTDLTAHRFLGDLKTWENR